MQPKCHTCGGMCQACDVTDSQWRYFSLKVYDGNCFSFERILDRLGANQILNI